MLSGRGAQLDPVNAGGVTPLLSAIFFGHTEVVELILLRYSRTSLPPRSLQILHMRPNANALFHCVVSIAWLRGARVLCGSGVLGDSMAQGCTFCVVLRRFPFDTHYEERSR